MENEKKKRARMYLDKTNTWRMECGCTEANVLDGNHNVCGHVETKEKRARRTRGKQLELEQSIRRN